MEKCPESMIFMLGGNKMNAKDILKKALTDMGADGLWNGSLGEEACGCGIDDLDPCDCCNINECEPAKLHEDGLFYPMKKANAKE